MANRKNFTVATDVQVYFCDPRSPWQRGSNENTNGLLRQYFPKGRDLSGYSQSYLNKIADAKFPLSASETGASVRNAGIGVLQGGTG